MVGAQNRPGVRVVREARAERSGFTLVETLIALVLSSFMIVLVSHTFLVQNEFYATQTLRAGAQDNVRSATELLASEIRDVAAGGVVVAGARTLTIRSPMTVGILCDINGSSNNGDVMTQGGEAAVETDEVAGLALRIGSTWSFVNATWGSVNGSDATSARNCFSNGADTVGARDDFHRLTNLNTVFSELTPTQGDAVMVFRETTFTIRQSQLDPTTLALYRQPYSGNAVEFATGMDTTAQFQFRTIGGSFVDSLTSELSNVDAVRIVVETLEPAPTGGADDVRFGWSVTVPLRSVR